MAVARTAIRACSPQVNDGQAVGQLGRDEDRVVGPDDRSVGRSRAGPTSPVRSPAAASRTSRRHRAARPAEAPAARCRGAPPAASTVSRHRPRPTTISGTRASSSRQSVAASPASSRPASDQVDDGSWRRRDRSERPSGQGIGHGDSNGDGQGSEGQRTTAPRSVKRPGGPPDGPGGASPQLTSVRSADTVRVTAAARSRCVRCSMAARMRPIDPFGGLGGQARHGRHDVLRGLWPAPRSARPRRRRHPDVPGLRSRHVHELLEPGRRRVPRPAVRSPCRSPPQPTIAPRRHRGRRRPPRRPTAKAPKSAAANAARKPPTTPTLQASREAAGRPGRDARCRAWWSAAAARPAVGVWHVARFGTIRIGRVIRATAIGSVLAISIARGRVRRRPPPGSDRRPGASRARRSPSDRGTPRSAHDRARPRRHAGGRAVAAAPTEAAVTTTGPDDRGRRAERQPDRPTVRQADPAGGPPPATIQPAATPTPTAGATATAGADADARRRTTATPTPDPATATPTQPRRPRIRRRPRRIPPTPTPDADTGSADTRSRSRVAAGAPVRCGG